MQNHGEIHRTFDDETQTLTRTLFIKDEQGKLDTASPIVTRFKYNQVGELVQLDLPDTSGQKQQLFCKYVNRRFFCIVLRYFLHNLFKSRLCKK